MGRILLLAWIVFVVVAYILARIFIVPDTDEARAVASVLFASGGLIGAVSGSILWRAR